jgi:hypothetical protein
MPKLYELMSGGVVECYCVGFEPDAKRLKEFDFTIASIREIENDAGGYHAIIPVFAKDENGKSKESVLLIDCNKEEENQYTPVAGHYDDVILYRSSLQFEEALKNLNYW